MEKRGDIGETQEGITGPLAEYQTLIRQSVLHAHQLCAQWINEEQSQRLSALSEQLNDVEARRHEVYMRLAIAKAEADIGAGLRALTLINREKHRCATCYFQFNVLEDNGTFKVRARADKEVCDKDLGDTECVKEQGQLRAQERRAAEKATKRLAQQETPAQPRMKKKARTKNPGHQGRQTGATNGHFPALSSIDEERA